MLIRNATAFMGGRFCPGTELRLMHGAVQEIGCGLTKGLYESELDLAGDYLLPGLVLVRRKCPAAELPALARRLYRAGAAAIVTDQPLPSIKPMRRTALLLTADAAALDALPAQLPLDAAHRLRIAPEDAVLALTMLPAQAANQRLIGCLRAGTPAPLTRWSRDWQLVAVLDQHAAD
ncbi:MAG: hypothetical protein ACI4MJ_05335 [Aristaeellaceae bacterium]